MLHRVLVVGLLKCGHACQPQGIGVVGLQLERFLNQALGRTGHAVAIGDRQGLGIFNEHLRIRRISQGLGLCVGAHRVRITVCVDITAPQHQPALCVAGFLGEFVLQFFDHLFDGWHCLGRGAVRGYWGLSVGGRVSGHGRWMRG